MLACWWALPAWVAAQPADDADSAMRPASWVVEMAAEEDTLWLGRVGPRQTEMYRRGVSDAFEAVRPLRARIVKAAATRGVLYVFIEGGAFMSYRAGDWSRERDLPGRVVPVDIIAADRELYALFASPPTGELEQLVRGTRPPTSQPFNAGAAALTIARYDSQGWVAVAACPNGLDVDGPEQPRLGMVRDTLCLFWLLSERQCVAYACWDWESAQWQNRGVTPPREHLSGFWFTNVSRVPALVTTATDTAGSRSLEMLRLFGEIGAARTAWRPTSLRLSELPAGVSGGKCTAVMGFNQHVVLLVADADGQSYLRFGRGDAEPAEATMAVAELFERHDAAGERQHWLQGLTFILLLASVLGLFLFRRDAMVTTLELPADSAIALILQRLIAVLIDLAPFVILFSLVLHVDGQAGLGELIGWAAGTDATGAFPANATLLWWACSCAAHAAYSLLMELLARRTVGKVLLGTRVMSEAAARPRAWQIIVRNLFRFMELMPPLWLVGFVIVLSRNRQRLGDIFARTIVVRRIAPQDNQSTDDADSA